MFLALFSRFLGVRGATYPRWGAILATLAVSLILLVEAEGQTVTKPNKRIIGATAVLTEASSGLPFAARVDTGAASCSLHVDKIEIKDEAKKPVDNIGKEIRFQIKNHEGKSAWVDATIASVVRVRSSTLKDGDFDRRYKVRLTLEWGDFAKEVLVTLNDRTDMNFPLLVGRNFLRHDFLVDVDIDSSDAPLANARDE